MPQHSKYLFWNVSQRLHLLIALALSWSRPVNKYGLDSASQISCRLCHSHTQLGPSLLKIICLRENAHLSSTALFASLRKWDGFLDSLWLCWPLTSSEKKARKLQTTEWMNCVSSLLLSLTDYRATEWKQIMKQISNHRHL